jgi:hypothetical protein
VAGELPREVHNAPLHLFSASPELVRFGQGSYQQHSEETSLLLRQLFERFRAEDFAMSYTMEDFKRDFFKEHFAKLTPDEQREVLQSLPPKELLGVLSAEQIREYLDELTTAHPPKPHTSRRKKSRPS